MKIKKYICASCGQEHENFDDYCSKCKQPKVVLKSVLSNITGFEETELYKLFTQSKESKNII